uniref:UDP-galactose translocator-like n=1 Tax=Saccoglossus kowalevskii TaxID=10224 RepID=A0ABM0M996_SACKO|nr:PREDICTED: UDP-galactose translocator-like [Saccoglossus kowalevskii]
MVNTEKDTSAPQKEPSKPIKYISLGLLVLQNAILILVMRYTRTTKTVEGHMYLASTAVVTTEVIKLATCLLVVLLQSRFHIGTFLSYLYNTIIANPMDTLKVVSVPALAYTLQNNLIYSALSHLSATTFHVAMQLKILTTAVFYVLWLKKTLGRVQWLSIFIAFIGVVIVQVQSTDPNEQLIAAHIEQNYLFGLSAVLVMCLSSGFAAVYLEKILKETAGSVWLRNIQLGIYGVSFSLVAMWLKDGAEISEKGFFHGYTPLVWFVACWQAFGGLLVAIVVKYADNILKVFATSVALLISTVVSVLMFGFLINIQFCIGSGLIIFSVFLYTQRVM